ncbi:hypothetical protein B0J13DRAFT_169847 [Dactylonectria estremocensis]|uniref:Hexosyltransferase n=1 Tax=Dactylonectria estremocensis TaxID=1079267 RepID=A0A9P9JAZ8_9HYPO|nr:hypothetical protein B0J13DRAFT_169847 [Dactylonectria estremocensis]
MFSSRASKLPSPVTGPSSTWCIPKRLIRIVAISLISTFLLVTLFIKKHNTHHAPFEAPNSGLVLHGKIVDDAPTTQYPLDPFPESPMLLPPSDQYRNNQSNPWLAAVICAASDVEHRMMIRSTWMKLYQDVPFDGRFVVSSPGPQWTEVVATENRTFGDLIVLDHLREDDVTANTIKTLEFYKWLVHQGKKYEFVSKMDTDLWLNARGFWDKFLVPRLSNSTGSYTATVERTVIGELYYSRSWDLVFPHGAMYTVTWDMVEMLASLQSKFCVVTGEDMAVATLMLKGRKQANFVNFKGTQKFDYDDMDSRGDGSAWARDTTHPNATRHAMIGGDAIAVHQLKLKEHWLKVAECFDEQGVKETPPLSGPAQTPPWTLRWSDFLASIGLSSRYISRFGRIPDFLWSFDDDGRWICDGIWSLGATRTGFIDEA